MKIRTQSLTRPSSIVDSPFLERSEERHQPALVGPAQAVERAARAFRLVAVTRAVQDRCREAIRNYLLVAETRVRAMNRWVE